MRPFLAIAVVAVAALGGACMTVTTIDGVQVASPPPPPQPGDAESRKRAEIRLQLAASYYQKGQFSIALEEVQRALVQDPNNPTAHGLQGLIYMDMGDRREAEASFARGLKIEPANPELNNNYGWFLCQTGRERESIDYFQRAAQDKLYATPAMPLQNAGVCLLQVRDLATSEQYLRRSFELDASSPVTKYHLTRLYLAKREPERAQFYFGLLEKQIDATAETLWLGLRLARAKGDLRTERQYADDLQRKFPDSREASALRRGAFDD
jgi:type IV pilus assembly protein PilF